MDHFAGQATEQPEARDDGPGPGSGLTADALIKRHFVLQDDRPGHLEDANLASMDPFLRGLLFTDGTVTRTLEAQSLQPVFVDVAAQGPAPLFGQTAKHLVAPNGTKAIRRRVRIGLGSSDSPVIWAESHIVPDRLPTGFLGVLDGSADGIGESLQQMRLESWREMLWFGLDRGFSPDWQPPGTVRRHTVLHRLYRVITLGKPAMLISESFAVEQRAGMYHLVDL